MSDTATAEMPPEVKEELDKIVTTTKRGFDPGERLRKRGLRRGTITLFLDDEKGAEIGWAHDMTNALGQFVAREREGVVGEIDVAREERAKEVAEYQRQVDNAGPLGLSTKDLMDIKKAHESELKMYDGHIAELEAKRDELVAELTKTGLTIKMRAIPPVIEKDCRRLARRTLGINEKNIPEEHRENYNLAFNAHLMTKMFQEVIDNETGAVNTETTYQDAIDLMGWLPPGQYLRLDVMMGKVQFTDHISQEIEAQEDFS